MERAFFNRVLGGIALTGTEFFYVGPLEVNPPISKCNPGLRHVKPVRQKWFDVACCPTNIARTIMNIGSFAFGEDGDTLYIHIPTACRIDSDTFKIVLDTQYPFGNTLRIEAMGSNQKIALRQPGSAPILRISINGKPADVPLQSGYYRLPVLDAGDVAEAVYDMTPRYVVSDPRVTSNVGKVAVMRGPVLYCAEQADNGEGISCLRLPHTASFTEMESFWGNGTAALRTTGGKAVFTMNDALYRDGLPEWESADIKLIPYSLWANRGEGEMRVYLNVQDET